MSKLVGWCSVYVYSAGIFILSVIPIKEISFSQPGWDKIVHFFIYLVLAFLVVGAAQTNKHSYPYRKGFLYAFFFGLSIEIIQYFLPYRYYEHWDVLCNLLGAIAGLLTYRMLSLLTHGKRSN